MLLPQGRDPVFGVERMHLERRDVHQEPRPDELVVHLMLAQDVADILTQEALDALPELLHPIHVGLIHPPGPIRSVGRARLERLDPRLDPEVPGDVGHEILDRRERAHRLDGDRLVERQLVEPGHAHEPRVPVHLGGARSALAGLAVPADGQVVGLLRLDLVNRVQHDHARGDAAVL